MSYTIPVPRRRRRWPFFVLVALVPALGAAWSGLWVYATGRAEATIAGWREREARAGRVHTCATQTIGGFPFRIEVRCTEPSTDMRGSTPLAFKANELLAAVQIYDPTLVIAELTGPLTLSSPGQPLSYVANWTLAQASVRGTPQTPERMSISIHDGVVDRIGDGRTTPMVRAGQAELHGRIVGGSINSNPVLEAVLRLTGATAPEVHPLLGEPLDGEVAATLRGLPNFLPKPWPERFRELQANGGTIEITNSRVRQGDVIASAAGTLSLTTRGNLDGELQVTAVNLEKVLKALDLERLLSQGRVGQTINALDRIMPGLGSLARQNAAPGILAGLGAMGKSTTLDDKPAITVPLRINDGMVYLGPLPVGRTLPLF